MDSKINTPVAVFNLGKLPLSKGALEALKFRFHEWCETLAYDNCDATPAFFAVVPPGTQITTELDQQIKAQYGWIPRYYSLIWDDPQI